MSEQVKLGKVAMTLGGDYSSSQSYDKLTCVQYDGCSWVSKKQVPEGVAPTPANSAYWQKISDRGLQGATGAPGQSYVDKELVPIVNDLTTGGSANVLSAEQGKVLKGELAELESETANIIFSVDGITLEDAGGKLTYQKLHLEKGKTYRADLKEGVVARLYGRGNFDGYDDFGEVTNSTNLIFTPNYDIDEVAVYDSSAASKVVFSVEKGALEHRVTIAEDNIANAKLMDFTNQLSSIGYSIINESSTLAYYKLPVSLVGGNYQWRLVRGSGDVSVYSTEQWGGAFKEQGYASSVGGVKKLDTTTPINYIGIYAPSSADGAEIVLETEGGSAKGLALSNKEEINNFVPIQNGQKAVFLSIKNGYIVAENGDFIAANTYSSTDYIQTTGIGKIKFPVYFSDAAGLAFYDKNKRYISGFRKTNEEYGSEIEIDVPFNADYVRVCYLNRMPNGDKFYIYLIANGDLLNANGINEKVYRLTPDNLTEEYIVYTNGDAISAASYRATGFIKVPKGRIKFPVYFSDAAGVAFYDHKKEYISGFGKTNESKGDIVEIEIPNSCQYIRICCIAQYADKLFLEYNGNIFDVVAEKDGDVNPCEYRETSGCRTFNNILCIGDSLTQGTFEYTNVQGNYVYYNDDRYSYPTFLKNISGRNVTNAGTGGLTTKSWWEMHQNDDFSGHDACIIALGRNDYVEGRETTSEERFTYMANIINAVRAANPKIKVFVATMLNYYKGTGADAVNNDMRVIAEQNNCFLVDISRYGKIEQRDYSYSHLTATGYEKVANYYFNYISYIMANQPREFMNVQFVGTDYSFNS